MRQSGQDPEQVRFCDILLRLRNAETTEEDWKHLMEQTPSKILDHSSFVNAIRLIPHVNEVTEYNVERLMECGYPIAEIKAVHTGAVHLLMMLVVWIQL